VVVFDDVAPLALDLPLVEQQPAFSDRAAQHINSKVQQRRKHSEVALTAQLLCKEVVGGEKSTWRGSVAKNAGRVQRDFFQFALAASGIGSRRASLPACRVAGMGASFTGNNA